MRTPLPPVAAVIGFIDAINRGDVDRLVALMSPGHRLQVLQEPPLTGRAGYPAASSAKCAASPLSGTEACSPVVMSRTVTAPASSSALP